LEKQLNFYTAVAHKRIPADHVESGRSICTDYRVTDNHSFVESLII